MAPYTKDWGPEGTAQGRRDRKRAAVHGPTLRRAVEAGAKIVYGTDMGGIEWTEPEAQEFPFLVQFGMTPMAAIQAATSRAAEMLDARGALGVVAPGAHADLVAVNGDPLQDVKVLEQVRFVMKDGAVFKSVP
jgi:imidazolonepropionase-like amidohydrolase